jgi:cytochrome P450
MTGIPDIVDLDDSTFDPFALEEQMFGDVEDPFSVLKALRRKAGVHALDYRLLFSGKPDIILGNLEQYTALSYDSVEKVLVDVATFTQEAWRRTLGLSFGHSLTQMDPPEHTRYRRIFQKAFLPNIVARWADTIIDPTIDELLEPLVSKGKAELVRDFAFQFPARIIYKQLQLPDKDIKVFYKLAVAQLAFYFDPKPAIEAGKKLGIYVQNMIDLRRREPGDDMVSLLATSEVDGELIPDRILVSFLRQLMNAAADTTYRATSNLLVGLLSNPDQLEAVRNDRSLVPRAVNETMRWEGPGFVLPRYVAKETVLEGVRIPEGAMVSAVIGSADRDENKFKDPDNFNIFRTETVRQVGFATGPHVCIGQHLAKLEMSHALNAILDKMPNIRLDPAMPAPKIRGMAFRVADQINVLFDT